MAGNRKIPHHTRAHGVLRAHDPPAQRAPHQAADRDHAVPAAGAQRLPLGGLGRQGALAACATSQRLSEPPRLQGARLPAHQHVRRQRRRVLRRRPPRPPQLAAPDPVLRAHGAACFVVPKPPKPTPSAASPSPSPSPAPARSALAVPGAVVHAGAGRHERPGADFRVEAASGADDPLHVGRRAACSDGRLRASHVVGAGHGRERRVHARASGTARAPTAWSGGSPRAGREFACPRRGSGRAACGRRGWSWRRRRRRRRRPTPCRSPVEADRAVPVAGGGDRPAPAVGDLARRRSAGRARRSRSRRWSCTAGSRSNSSLRRESKWYGAPRPPMAMRPSSVRMA